MDATTTQAAPAQADNGAMGGTAQVSESTPWSLDSWQPDQWDALPEQIRTAADARYKGVYDPQLSELRTSLSQHQADLAAARKEAQDARAAHLRGDPYAAQQLREAQDKLAAIQKEFDGYKGQWSERTYTERWDKARAEAQTAMQQEWRQATQRELDIFAPWAAERINDQPNPEYDAKRVEVVNELDKMLEGVDLPWGWFLQASGLNEAQRTALLHDLAGGKDAIQALREAMRPPKHTPSAAQRAQVGAPGVDGAPRPVVRKPAPSMSDSWSRAAETVRSTPPNPR